MMGDIMWWAYRHHNGTVHVKRFFDQGDIEEARESSFVEVVTGQFPAPNRDSAIRIAEERLK